MLVSRLSHLTGKINEMEIPITPQQLVAVENRKAPIQTIVPHLSPEQREFLMTGMTPEEWDAAFPPDEEDE
jgi:hypothetical protein